MRIERGEFEIDDDPERIDFDVVVASLQATYWGEGLSPETIVASFRNADAFGLYRNSGAQIGCARVVTDRVRFAWLSDVVVDADYRGHGLGTWFTETILAHPNYRDVQRWVLATRDAHHIYAKFGFAPADATRFMVMSRA